MVILITGHWIWQVVPSTHKTSEQLGRFASLHHNIYVAADHTLVDVDHAVDADGLTMFTHDDPMVIAYITHTRQ